MPVMRRYNSTAWWQVLYVPASKVSLSQKNINLYLSKTLSFSPHLQWEG